MEVPTIYIYIRPYKAYISKAYVSEYHHKIWSGIPIDIMRWKNCEEMILRQLMKIKDLQVEVFRAFSHGSERNTAIESFS